MVQKGVKKKIPAVYHDNKENDQYLETKLKSFSRKSSIVILRHRKTSSFGSVCVKVRFAIILYLNFGKVPNF